MDADLQPSEELAESGLEPAIVALCDQLDLDVARRHLGLAAFRASPAPHRHQRAHQDCDQRSSSSRFFARSAWIELG